MSPEEMRFGVADYDYPRRQRIALEPKPTVCPVCLTDTEVSSCPANCPTRQTEETR